MPASEYPAKDQIASPPLTNSDESASNASEGYQHSPTSSTSSGIDKDITGKETGRIPTELSEPVLKRGVWSAEEDELLLKLINKTKPLKWVSIAGEMRTRSSKQCRERYHNYLKPSLAKGPISDAEGARIKELVDMYGKRWAVISRQMPGRSDNAIKNWWNALASRKRTAKPSDAEGARRSRNSPGSSKASMAQWAPSERNMGQSGERALTQMPKQVASYDPNQGQMHSQLQQMPRMSAPYQNMPQYTNMGSSQQMSMVGQAPSSDIQAHQMMHMAHMAQMTKMLQIPPQYQQQPMHNPVEMSANQSNQRQNSANGPIMLSTSKSVDAMNPTQNTFSGTNSVVATNNVVGSLPNNSVNSKMLTGMVNIASHPAPAHSSLPNLAPANNLNLSPDAKANSGYGPAFIDTPNTPTNQNKSPALNNTPKVEAPTPTGLGVPPPIQVSFHPMYTETGTGSRITAVAAAAAATTASAIPVDGSTATTLEAKAPEEQKVVSPAAVTHKSSQMEMGQYQMSMNPAQTDFKFATGDFAGTTYNMSMDSRNNSVTNEFLWGPEQQQLIKPEPMNDFSTDSYEEAFKLRQNSILRNEIFKRNDSLTASKGPISNLARRDSSGFTNIFDSVSYERRDSMVRNTSIDNLIHH